MNRPLSMSLLAMLFALPACRGGNESYVRKGQVKQTIVQEPEQKRYIEAIGIGASDSTLTNATQRKATSRDAAIVQAQYEMLSLVKGVQLEGGITVERAMQTDSRIETYLKEIIKGAQIIRSEWTEDDGCVVTLRLDRKQLETHLAQRQQAAR